MLVYNGSPRERFNQAANLVLHLLASRHRSIRQTVQNGQFLCRLAQMRPLRNDSAPAVGASRPVVILAAFFSFAAGAAASLPARRGQAGE
jgi:hypothetical protein